MNKICFSLYDLFQSGMVLQRHKPVIIWGNAPAGSRITLTLQKEGSAPVCAHTQTSSDNTWQITLPPQEAGEHFFLTAVCRPDTPCSDGSRPDSMCSDSVYSGSVINLSEISFGEIWLACGQSNMEFFLRYDADWEEVRQYQKNPHIHLYNVPQCAFAGHDRHAEGYGVWLTEKDPGFECFSAPGYSFARHIQPELDVPVGIIGCNWGGTTASAWLDETCLETAPLSVYLQEYEEAVRSCPPETLKQISLEAWAFEDSAQHAQDFMPLLYGRDRTWQMQYMKDHAEDPIIPMGPYHINRPGGLYHQMLEPLIPFAIRGVLWYQGESDAGHADIYDRLLSALITSWRRKWNDDFSFLLVQLAPFGVWLDCDSRGYCEVRHRQELVSRTLPNTHMVSIMDIGSYYDIHPKQKTEVGRRLALSALGNVYGKTLLCESPSLLTATRQKNLLTLTFSHAEGLHGDAAPSLILMQEGTEIAVTSLTLSGDTLLLRADALTVSPCTLYFAWADYAEVHLWNSAGLPVRPFCVTLA